MRSSILFLMVLFTASIVIAHPAVSSPIQAPINPNEKYIEDLYADSPKDRPLHTTVLLAGPQMTPASARSGDELR
jgi:hypothetical protein